MIWKFLKQNVLTPKGLNLVQHRVSRIGLLLRHCTQIGYRKSSIKSPGGAYFFQALLRGGLIERRGLKERGAYLI